MGCLRRTSAPAARRRNERRYPLQFAPGTAQTYSNTAYWLLHLVVEKASGMTYQRYLERMIFEPLGMRSSGICHGAPGLRRRATGYGVSSGETRRARENVPVNYLGSSRWRAPWKG